MIEKTKNKRYQQLNNSGKEILLDMDSNKLTWLLPFLVWLLPIKGYKDMKIPLAEKEVRNETGKIILMSSILSSIFIRMTNRGFGDLSLLINGKEIASILLLLSMVIVLAIRYFFRYKTNELKTTKEMVYVKFNFENGLIGKLQYIGKVFFVTVACYFLVLYFSFVFLNTYLNVIVIVPIILIEYLILIVNTTILPPTDNCTIIIEKKV